MTKGAFWRILHKTVKHQASTTSLSVSKHYIIPCKFIWWIQLWFFAFAYLWYLAFILVSLQSSAGPLPWLWLFCPGWLSTSHFWEVQIQRRQWWSNHGALPKGFAPTTGPARQESNKCWIRLKHVETPCQEILGENSDSIICLIFQEQPTTLQVYIE